MSVFTIWYSTYYQTSLAHLKFGFRQVFIIFYTLDVSPLVDCYTALTTTWTLSVQGYNQRFNENIEKVENMIGIDGGKPQEGGIKKLKNNSFMIEHSQTF